MEIRDKTRFGATCESRQPALDSHPGGRPTGRRCLAPSRRTGDTQAVIDIGRVGLTDHDRVLLNQTFKRSIERPERNFSLRRNQQLLPAGDGPLPT